MTAFSSASSSARPSAGAKTAAAPDRRRGTGHTPAARAGIATRAIATIWAAVIGRPRGPAGPRSSRRVGARDLAADALAQGLVDGRRGGCGGARPRAGAPPAPHDPDHDGEADEQRR